MIPFIARAFLWLTFGFLSTDIINEFKLFGRPLPFYAVMGPAMLFFGLQEAILKRLEIKQKSSTGPEFVQSRLFKIFYIVMWIFVIGLLLTIPLVWWGLIKKATIAGGDWNLKTLLPK
jgi:hypothetical protein